MSKVPPRRARARLEKANGVTSSSSEESDCEPQTSRMARFQALKKRFETPTKSEEESPSHETFKSRDVVSTGPLARGHLIWPPGHLLLDSTGPDWPPNFKA